jgi:hypothetical protein
VKDRDEGVRRVAKIALGENLNTQLTNAHFFSAANVSA